MSIGCFEHSAAEQIHNHRRLEEMPFIKTNGKQLYYVRQSPNSYAISILMIHGLGSSSSFYVPIFPKPVQSGFDCIALDTYGRTYVVTSSPVFGNLA